MYLRKKNFLFKKMSIENLPCEIWIIIMNNIYDLEKYDINEENDNRSYWFENEKEEYEYTKYFAYYYGILSQVSKNMNIEFKRNYYWRYLLDYDKIKHKNRNLMKRYISVKVIPHYKNIILYYNRKYKDEKIELECCNRNTNKIYSGKILPNWKKSSNPFVLIDGYWATEIKENISKNCKSYSKIFYRKYSSPIKKVYNWELYVSNNHNKIIKKNLSYYLKAISYYEGLYNSCIN